MSTSNSSISWDSVQNEESLIPPRPKESESACFFFFPRSPGDSYTHESWRFFCSVSAKNSPQATSLVVQWLRLHAPKAGGPGLIFGQGTGILHPATMTPCATIKTRRRQHTWILKKKPYPKSITGCWKKVSEPTSVLEVGWTVDKSQVTFPANLLK